MGLGNPPPQSRSVHFSSRLYFSSFPLSESLEQAEVTWVNGELYVVYSRVHLKEKQNAMALTFRKVVHPPWSFGVTGETFMDVSKLDLPRCKSF